MSLLQQTCLLGAAALVLSLLACSSGICENTETMQVPSPDGTRKIVVFERSCGATTGFSTHVSLFSARDDIGQAAGNTFIANDNRGASLTLNIQWTGPRSVRIKLPSDARVFKKETQISGVSIEYGKGQ